MTIKTLTIAFAALALGAALGSVPAFVQQNVPGYSSQGTVIGVLNAQGLHDQATPPVYFITLFDAEIDMKTDYPSLAPATFQPFGGRYVVHGGKMVTFEGESPGQFVVIAFDSMENVQAWRASDAFKNAYNPQKLGKVRVFAVEGLTQ
jgi:uncharacterized protein (DUF1330 family)